METHDSQYWQNEINLMREKYPPPAIADPQEEIATEVSELQTRSTVNGEEVEVGTSTPAEATCSILQAHEEGRMAVIRAFDEVLAEFRRPQGHAQNAIIDRYRRAYSADSIDSKF